jgi:DNA-binding NarL/FixJ family response regulator
MTKIPEIILADDNLLFRQGLKSFLTAEKIADVVGEVSNGRDLIKLISEHRPDIVIMDIDMPFMDGFEATQRLLEISPKIKVLVCTMFYNEEYYERMIKLGAKAFLSKSDGIDELETAINELFKGKSYFTAEQIEKMRHN